MKVEQFYNKNQFIIYGEGKIIFQSYNSTIAKIENGELILGYDWDYSKTTMKYLYKFFNQYYCDINFDTRVVLRDVEYSKNKRLFIQKLIDKKIIKLENL